MKRAPNFDHLARIYRWMELFTFGPWLARCRFAFLPRLLNARNALVLGDGDGRFTARLLQQNPSVLIDALDASPRMLQALVLNASPRSGRIRVHPADARLWIPANPPYDLVATHFFLDCLSTREVADLAARLRPHLTPHARWVISEFATPRSPFGWFIALPVVTALYFAFGVLTGLDRFHLPNHHQALSQAGFTLLDRQQRLGGLLVSELWSPAEHLGGQSPTG